MIKSSTRTRTPGGRKDPFRVNAHRRFRIRDIECGVDRIVGINDAKVKKSQIKVIMLTKVEWVLLTRGSGGPKIEIAVAPVSKSDHDANTRWL